MSKFTTLLRDHNRVWTSNLWDNGLMPITTEPCAPLVMSTSSLNRFTLTNQGLLSSCSFHMNTCYSFCMTRNHSIYRSTRYQHSLLRCGQAYIVAYIHSILVHFSKENIHKVEPFELLDLTVNIVVWFCRSKIKQLGWIID